MRLLVACGTLLCAYAKWGRHKDMLVLYTAVRGRGIVPPISVFNYMISSLQNKKMHAEVINFWGQILDSKLVPTSLTYAVIIGFIEIY
jgi:pentatricopeptide repeat protein